MFCEVCKKYDTAGTFVTGCANLKIQTIKTRACSEGHLKNELRAKTLPLQISLKVIHLHAKCSYQD